MTKKIIDWAELEKAEDVFSTDVLCPSLSKAMGEDVHVKVRAISHMEFLAAIDMPMDEINQMVGADAEPEAFAKAIREQSEALGLEGLLMAQESVIKIGLVEPNPADGNLRKLTMDFNTIFKAIVDLTMPPKAVAQAGQFPADGE